MRFQQWFEAMRMQERKRVVSMLFAIRREAIPEGYRDLYDVLVQAVDDEYHHFKRVELALAKIRWGDTITRSFTEEELSRMAKKPKSSSPPQTFWERLLRN
jgi:hypothetical protein